MADNKDRFYSLALSFLGSTRSVYVSRYNSEAVRRTNGILLVSILLVPVNIASIPQLSKEGSILPQAMDRSFPWKLNNQYEFDKKTNKSEYKFKHNLIK